MLKFIELQSDVQKTLNHDSVIASKSLKKQFEQLIFQSLLNLNQLNWQFQSAVIMINVLNECEHN